MCLAMPGKIVSIEDPERGIATIDFQGVKRETNLSLIEDPKIGDYVLVHVGFAIQKLEPEEALETLKDWEKLLAIESEMID